MSENIVNKINQAEEDAKVVIEESKKNAHALVVKAGKKVEMDVAEFVKKMRERLKTFEEEKKSFYKAEAAKIKKEGEKSKDDYLKGVEAELPAIKKKVLELIRRELCL